MRSLFLSVSIAVFIGAALLPPQGVSVSAMIADGTNLMDSGKARSFFSGNPVSAVQLLRAGAVLENVARSPAVQTAVQAVGGTTVTDTVSQIGAVVKDGKAITPQTAVTVLGTAAKTLTSTLIKEQTTDRLAAATATADPALKRVLEKISWARDKSDVRLCADALAANDPSGGIKSGDVLALCLALTNREPDRCAQVSDPGLSALCSTELAS